MAFQLDRAVQRFNKGKSGLPITGTSKGGMRDLY